MKARHAVLLAAAMLAVGVGEASPAAAATSVRLSTTINGQNVGSATADHPIKLDPAKPAVVNLTVTNTRSHAVTIHRVELSGRVVGLAFFAFDTAVSLPVPAGKTGTLSYSLDLTGLRGQATGLIGGAVTIFDDHGHQISRQSMVTDVRGSLYSVYGLFGFALLLLTLLALLDTALALARHRMPANRWRRGLRFLTPGVGIGLVLVFTLSAVRVWVPSADRWLLVGAGFAVVFFALGYLTPTPVSDAEADEDDDDWDDDGLIEGLGARPADLTDAETTAAMPPLFGPPVELVPPAAPIASSWPPPPLTSPIPAPVTSPAPMQPAAPISAPPPPR